MARLTRLVVVSSCLLAVAAGLWPLVTRPGLMASAAAVFVIAAMLARWLPPLAITLVFLSAYVSYGVVRLIAGPEPAAIPFFLAGFAGVAIGVGPWTRWQARGPWRVPLAWWATWVAVTWIGFAARELNYSLAPSLAAGQIVTAALLQMCLALWMDRLLAEPDRRPIFRDDDLPLRTWRAPLIVSALATAAAAVYQRWFDPAWLSGEPWIGLGRSVGLMGDANPMGVATGLWAPLAWGAIARSPVTAAPGAVVTAVLWLAAWLSGARTTLILIGAGAAALALLAATALGWSRRTIVATGLAVTLAAVVTVTVIAPVVAPTTPAGRLLSALPKTSIIDAAYELLWRRDGYGLAAVEAINEHPVIGVGVGRFWQLSTSYHQRLTGRAIPPDNAQNLWRQTLVEQGLIGLLPVLWLTVLTATGLVGGEPTGQQLLLRVMVAGMGLSLLVGYPVQDPAVAVTLATLVAMVGRDRG
jgi:hypothetical protein